MESELTRTLEEREGARLGISLVLLLGLLTLCAVIWQQFVTDKLYNCTDSVGPPEFLLPSAEWVHNPIEVEKVATRRSMSEPDMIKKGWSLGRLRLLRWTMVAGSIAISLLPMRYLWRPRRQGYD